MSDAPTTTLPAIQVPAGPAAPAAAACRSCGAPLAADQRYCLNCGTRAGAPRVDWAASLAGDGASDAAPAAAAGGGGSARTARLLDRVGGPMGAAAVVLVALGIGFLLGQGGQDGGGPATVIQRPPVINVQGGGTTAGSVDPTAADTAADTGRRGGRGGAEGGSGSTAGVPTATQDDAGGDLDRLQQQPTEQATEGAPPRRDSRPAGGGTEAETIG